MSTDQDKADLEYWRAAETAAYIDTLEHENKALKAKIEKAKSILEEIEPHHIGIADEIDAALRELE